MSEPCAAAGGLVRVYPAITDNPARPEPGASLVWSHGGGFQWGYLDMPEADAVARSLAARGVTVVSVDYRRASETVHFPLPSDDVLAAYLWTRSHADELEIDPARIAIGGASAGGNLAAGATLRLLADGGPTPALVVLAYPTLLAVQPEPDAALRAALDADPEADTFGPDAVLGMYEDYLGGPVEDAPLAAIPGLATAGDLANFPPTLMINGDVDELRVSGEHFARTLAAAGRDVVVFTEPGTRHGHLNRPEEPGATASVDRIAARLAALPASPNPHTSAPIHTSALPGSVDSGPDVSTRASTTLPTEGSSA